VTFGAQTGVAAAPEEVPGVTAHASASTPVAAGTFGGRGRSDAGRTTPGSSARRVSFLLTPEQERRVSSGGSLWDSLDSSERLPSSPRVVVTRLAGQPTGENMATAATAAAAETYVVIESIFPLLITSSSLHTIWLPGLLWCGRQPAGFTFFSRMFWANLPLILLAWSLLFLAVNLLALVLCSVRCWTCCISGLMFPNAGLVLALGLASILGLGLFLKTSRLSPARLRLLRGLRARAARAG